MGFLSTSTGIRAITDKILRFLGPCFGSSASHPPPLPLLSDDADTDVATFAVLGQLAALRFTAAVEFLGNDENRCEDGMISPEVHQTLACFDN
jgi:hypothetical protein